MNEREREFLKYAREVAYENPEALVELLHSMQEVNGRLAQETAGQMVQFILGAEASGSSVGSEEPASRVFPGKYSKKGEPVGLYRVKYFCHRCGQRHLVVDGFALDGHARGAGNLVEVYPSGYLPPALVKLLAGSLVWCEQAGYYVPIVSTVRVSLAPSPAGGPSRG